MKHTHSEVGHIYRLEHLKKDDDAVVTSTLDIGLALVRLVKNPSADFISWFLSRSFGMFREHVNSFVKHKQIPTADLAPRLHVSGEYKDDLEFPIIQDDGTVIRRRISVSELASRTALDTAASPARHPFAVPHEVIENTLGTVTEERPVEAKHYKS